MAIFTVKHVVFTLLVVLIVVCAVGTIVYFRKERIGGKPKLVVMAMGGLHFKHIQADTMPFITEFYRNGVYCPQMQPVFPTKSETNLFSIATGMCVQLECDCVSL